MVQSELEWKSEEVRLEEVRLEEVKKEIIKQAYEIDNLKQDIKEDATRIQRELWESIGSLSISNGLDQIVDFMQSIQLMQAQKTGYAFNKKLEEQYKKMLLSPYFGRIDFIEEGEETTEECYIGIGNLISEDYHFLVYDWRAPIASMFYDYEIGEASYECPEGIIRGKLMMKRQYNIQNGKLEYMFDSSLKIDDEVLQDILGKSSDCKMKAIVTTIQREQNKVIRNDEYANLIVQGPAGSGKTSIALHRIAYLLYKHREKITSKNIVIFSPNNLFNEYISNVLPELGEDNIGQTTFQDYMHEALGDELQKEGYCNMMEYILNAKKEASYLIRIKSIKFKSSMQFLAVLKVFISYIETMERDFEDILIGGHLVISAKDIQELFTIDYRRFPLKKKLLKIRERILFLLEPYEKSMLEEKIEVFEASGEYIDRREIVALSRQAVKSELGTVMYRIDSMTNFNLLDSYKVFMRHLEMFLNREKLAYDANEISDIKVYTLESLRTGRLNYEDQIVILYLKDVLGDLSRPSEIKYVIIDEAQDYTPLQYEIFHQLFNHANKTILGDIHQSINPFMNVGDYSNVSHIFEKENTCVIHLTKSYRSTMEITQLARRILGNKLTDEYVERSGEEPKILGFQDSVSRKKKLIEAIALYKEKRYQSIGIITKTIEEAKEAYDTLQDVIPIKIIASDAAEYRNDLVIIPVYLAKGLEFDVVILYNVGEEIYSGDEDKLLLYTACTRALHILDLYYLGERSSLLEE